MVRNLVGIVSSMVCRDYFVLNAVNCIDTSCLWYTNNYNNIKLEERSLSLYVYTYHACCPRISMIQHSFDLLGYFLSCFERYPWFRKVQRYWYNAIKVYHRLLHISIHSKNLIHRQWSRIFHIQVSRNIEPRHELSLYFSNIVKVKIIIVCFVFFLLQWYQKYLEGCLKDQIEKSYKAIYLPRFLDKDCFYALFKCWVLI